MPRPKKPDQERRSHVVSFRLTVEECARLEAEATAAGLTIHECARAKTTGGAPVVVSPVHAESRGMFDLRHELRRVGVNMNQIARQLNMTGEHDPSELRDASKHLDEIFVRLLAGRAIH